MRLRGPVLWSDTCDMTPTYFSKVIFHCLSMNSPLSMLAHTQSFQLIFHIQLLGFAQHVLLMSGILSP